MAISFALASEPGVSRRSPKLKSLALCSFKSIKIQSKHSPGSQVDVASREPSDLSASSILALLVDQDARVPVAVAFFELFLDGRASRARLRPSCTCSVSEQIVARPGQADLTGGACVITRITHSHGLAAMASKSWLLRMRMLPRLHSP